MEMDSLPNGTAASPGPTLGSGPTAAGPPPSSKLSHLADSLKLEHQFLRVPFEYYKKTIRANHRVVEKEISAVINGVSEAADKNDMSSDDAVNHLSSLVSRLQGLKRKLEEGSKTEHLQAQRCRARLDHLESADVDLKTTKIYTRKTKQSVAMEYRKLKDQDQDGSSAPQDLESLRVKPVDLTKWKLKSAVTIALTVFTSSQAILIVWSKRAGKYEYSVTTANFSVEALKCAISLAALARIWSNEGVTEDNRLSAKLDEVIVYPIPAFLYLIKNLLQYYIFAYVDAPGYQILKNFNIISTGILYRIILKRKLSEIQWAAFIILCAGCTTAQLNPKSDSVLQTPFQGWVMAIVMALLSGFAGVYTEAIMKKRPARNINVQNFWMYVFGMAFNAVAILVQDFDAVMNKGFFHGYSFITVLMIFNHALSGIAVSMVMKYADNIVKVYSTSVAMLLTAVVSVFLFGFHLSLAFFLGSTVVSVAVYLHSIGKVR